MKAITNHPRILAKIAAGKKLAKSPLTIDVSSLIKPGHCVEQKKTILPVVLTATCEPLMPTIDGLSGSEKESWYCITCCDTPYDLNGWDLCHLLVENGIGDRAVTFAEPDFEQKWHFGNDVEYAVTGATSCSTRTPQDPRLPNGNHSNWFSDDEHSQLTAARAEIGKPKDCICIAHIDSGYDPRHDILPPNLNKDLQRNFVHEKRANDASDHNTTRRSLGHGTATLALLASQEYGGAAALNIVPIRVASSEVTFRNSAIARALDYVAMLVLDKKIPVQVAVICMGGLPSQAWADAVNALYELGVLVVAASGNNISNQPTHGIAYPARFERVIAACGIMADGKPYADLANPIMAGNYGPTSAMRTAMAGYTPNIPWARFGCGDTIDMDGRGTSAAAVQIAAAAGLWLQKYRRECNAYAKPWMRTEAVRLALFEKAGKDANIQEWIGQGSLRAHDALKRAPAKATELRKTPADTLDFGILGELTGEIARNKDVHLRMMEQETLQHMLANYCLEHFIADPKELTGSLTATKRQQILQSLKACPGASRKLRERLEPYLVEDYRPPRCKPTEMLKAQDKKVEHAISPPVPRPKKRLLRTFAFDPLLGTHIETVDMNEAVLSVRWEKLEAGPVGEYIEVVDVDPSSNAAYAPVDLEDSGILAQNGLAPSEGSPQFHQQMVYAVAMRTIENFERALGRSALWAPRENREKSYTQQYVQRLRIYPHAIREANSYYCPEKSALLFGYFPASKVNSGSNLPGGRVFCCLSHDVVAHETTHALLDGIHRRFKEATNPDILAFHEAFSDIVALFQHFSMPEALRDQIARTRGDLSQQNMLGQLAQQFGEAIGHYGALRSAIGTEENGKWIPAIPSTTDYTASEEPHARGAVLVAAIFDAFLAVYKRRSRDLIRLATSGSGVLPPGDISRDLVNRLAYEASKTASHILSICIRALDYCPPVDLTYGDYLRALMTADRDLVAEDPYGYRPALIQGFRARGIYPHQVSSLSVESLCWEHPDVKINFKCLFNELSLNWSIHTDRRQAFDTTRRNAWKMHEWLKNKDNLDEADAEKLGFFRKPTTKTIDGIAGTLRGFEVHSVRPVRRIGPDGQQITELTVEITQSWLPDDRKHGKIRGGATLLIDTEKEEIRYCIRKRLTNKERFTAQRSYQMHMQEGGDALRATYFDDASRREPFAMLHRGL